MGRNVGGQRKDVGESLRLILLNCDLRITYGEAQRKVFEQEYELKSKLGTKSALREAMRAKAKANCYAIYVDNVQKIKAQTSNALQSILERYDRNHRRIWIMYFIENASYAEIMAETDYSKESIAKIVRKFKDDISDLYGGEIQ